MSMLGGCVSNADYSSNGGGGGSSYNGGTSQAASQEQSGETNPGETIGQDSQQGTTDSGEDAGFGAISG